MKKMTQKMLKGLTQDQLEALETTTYFSMMYWNTRLRESPNSKIAQLSSGDFTAAVRLIVSVRNREFGPRL